MNYEITSQWKTLSTIMGDDYDSTKKYKLHINGDKAGNAFLRYTTESSPNETDLKTVLPAYYEVILDVNQNPSLKAHIYNSCVNVDVTVIAEEE